MTDDEHPKIKEIFIIDDNPTNLMVVYDTLELEGYRVQIDSSGLSALQKIKEQLPDLILLDVMMPDINGYEIITQLKNDDETKDIPVIFMSALSEVFDKVKGFQLGAVDYITKPFQLEEVLVRINNHIMLQTLKDELQKKNIELEQKVEERTNELVKANEALKIAKDKAEESDNLKTEFLAQISHEIRTPLNALNGFANFISEKANETKDKELKEFSSHINDSSERIIRTIELMIIMSQLNSNTFETSPEYFHIMDDVLNEVLYVFKNRIKAAGLSFSVKENKSIPEVYADKYSIKVIIENLLQNAIQFTHQGEIEVSFDENNDYCIVMVKDTGIGISDEFRPHIFDPFSQEYTGLSRRYDGSGLGLPCVKKLIELNAGKIEVETKKDQGSSFRVFIPKIDEIKLI